MQNRQYSIEHDIKTKMLDALALELGEGVYLGPGQEVLDHLGEARHANFLKLIAKTLRLTCTNPGNVVRVSYKNFLRHSSRALKVRIVQQKRRSVC